MIKYLPLAALVLAFSNTFSAALEADVSKITSASPARAWEAIGDFCGLSTWHPEVQSCALTEVMGAKLRNSRGFGSSDVRSGLAVFSQQ